MDNEIFISYAQPDRNTAFAIHDLLQANGLKSWIDKSKNGINTGDYFDKEIVKAIRNCKLFVLVHSIYSNISSVVIQEVRNASAKRKYIFKLDNSRYSDDLALSLEGLHYIDAGGNNYQNAFHKLLNDLKAGLNIPSPGTNPSTDKILLNNGLKLLQTKNYKEAESALGQYSSIAPNDTDGKFYLTLAIAGGKKPRKLDGIIVKKIESLLLPCISHPQYGHINVLLALIKYGYYTMNGFIDPQPDSYELLNQVQLDKEKAKEIMFHVCDPDNTVWRSLQEFCTG
ncbi:MAG: toll/interleukin-1 receptor domain-containing protein [Bacteroidota bacterium]